MIQNGNTAIANCLQIDSLILLESQLHISHGSFPSFTKHTLHSSMTCFNGPDGLSCWWYGDNPGQHVLFAAAWDPEILDILTRIPLIPGNGWFVGLMLGPVT